MATNRKAVGRTTSSGTNCFLHGHTAPLHHYVQVNVKSLPSFDKSTLPDIDTKRLKNQAAQTRRPCTSSCSSIKDTCRYSDGKIHALSTAFKTAYQVVPLTKKIKNQVFQQ